MKIPCPWLGYQRFCHPSILALIAAPTETDPLPRAVLRGYILSNMATLDKLSTSCLTGYRTSSEIHSDPHDLLHHHSTMSRSNTPNFCHRIDVSCTTFTTTIFSILPFLILGAASALGMLLSSLPGPKSRSMLRCAHENQ